MYREGLLPNGEPMQAIVQGDISVSGTSFTCVSCHQRGGIGSVEGTVYTPPTNAKSLFQPLRKFYKGVEVKYNESPFHRPAYTEETLAEVLRNGMDPYKKVLNEVMPRYLLKDSDMTILISYLKSLSATYSPGVTDKTINFATVISEDIKPEDSKAMLDLLDRFILEKNNLALNYQRTTTARDRLMAKAMSTSKELEPRKLTLARWVLKGPPETWRRQLESYNRAEPAFALLGGIVNGNWQTVHQFSEENRIPSLFPVTDFPVINESDWYTMYISKGFYQEGESAAKFLKGTDEATPAKSVLQIVRSSPEGEALSRGFTETWQSQGLTMPATVTLKAGEILSTDNLQQILLKHKPDAVVLWDGEGAIPLIQSLTGSGAKMVFVSANYLGKNVWSLPEMVRDFTYLTYPYRLPQDKVLSMMGTPINFNVSDNRIEQKTYALVEVLSMAIMEIKGNYFRDHFLDVIGMSMDRVVPLYERLSFGPGQRYASKGCYIVQLNKGPEPQLVKKSDWVIH